MKKLRLILALVLLLTGTLTACGNGTSGGNGGIEVYVADAPSKEVSAVIIKAKDIQVHKAGADNDTWVTVLSDPPSFDLVKVSNNPALLGTSQLAAGNYTQVRLSITDVTLTVNGKEVKATVPSDKLKLVGEFTIEAGKQTPITIDFDGEKSVVLEGQDKASLKPTVKLIIGKLQPVPPASSPSAASSSPTPDTRTP